MFGLPDCAVNGCPWPGIVEIRLTDDSGPITAHVCPLCVRKTPELLKAISSLREEDRLIEQRREADGKEETE